MKSLNKTTDCTAAMRREEISEAIRAWHRGESLSEEQQELIELARRETLARAHGVHL